MRILLSLLIVVAIACAPLYGNAQGNVPQPGSQPPLSASYYKSLQTKTASLQKQLDKQTGKRLRKLQKLQSKLLHKLEKLDSCCAIIYLCTQIQGYAENL